MKGLKTGWTAVVCNASTYHLNSSVTQYHFIYKYSSCDKTSIINVLFIPLVPSLPSHSINLHIFTKFKYTNKLFMRQILVKVNVCVNKKTHGVVNLGLGWKKSWDQVGIWYILSQFYPSFKLLCDSVKQDVV